MMDFWKDVEVRAECLEQAMQSLGKGAQEAAVLALAQKFYDWVVGGKPK